MHKKDALGHYGEAVAARYLERHGWLILGRNWRCSAGEIDLIAQRNGVVAICEVKTRRSVRFGTPLEAVTPVKAQRLRRLAGLWLAQHQQYAQQVRVDVIAVLVDDAGHSQVQHIEAVEL
jgi:putative endonuclease